METWVDMQPLVGKFGEVLVGLLVGELMHRIIMLYTEMQHIQERYKGSKASLLSAVFSNCHHQAVSVPALTFLGVGTILISGPTIQSLVNIATISMVYTGLREVGALDNSLEDMQVLEEKNALLGPGLATNYWIGFLKWIIKGDVSKSAGFQDGQIIGNLKDAFEELQAGMQPQEEDSIDEVIYADGQISNRLVMEGTLFRIFRKIIILLPSSCHLNTRDSKALARDHKIFLHCAPEAPPTAPPCRCEGPCDCAHQHCSHDYHFRLASEAVQRRPPIKLTIYYIYENEEEEPEKGCHNPLAKKIFVAFDFPMLLQSAMGPGRKMADDAAGRAKNVETFQATLASFLASNEYQKFREWVTFHPYNTDRSDTRPLAAQLRERIMMEGNPSVLL